MTVFGYDASHWGIWQLRGSDCLEHLHNQTTQDLRDRKPGKGCETALVSSTARLIDLITVYVGADFTWLITAPDTPLETTLGRFLPFTQSSLHRQDHRCLFVWGDAIAAHLRDRGCDLPGPAWGDYCEQDGITIARGTPIALDGFTLLIPAEQEFNLDTLTWLDAIAWDDLRIRQGRPWPGSELTADYNPLEATLGQTLSLTKGCYLGQETITRLHTYRGLKQQLWGLESQGAIAPGATITTLAGDKVGVVTSVTSDRRFGLGYIRTKAGGAGLEVKIDDTQALVVELPFAQRVSAALPESV